MTVVIRFQPGLRPMIQKHETHDQSTHGNWAGKKLSDELKNWNPEDKVPSSPRNAGSVTEKALEAWEHGHEGQNYIELFRKYAAEELGLPIPQTPFDQGGYAEYMTQRGFGAPSRNEVRGLLTAIENSKPQPTLYRGVRQKPLRGDGSSPNTEEFTALKNVKEGDTFDMPLVSTSRSLGVASWYAGQNNDSIILRIKEGAKGYSVPNPLYLQDSEVIVSGKFKVNSVEKISSPYWQRTHFEVRKNGPQYDVVTYTPRLQNLARTDQKTAKKYYDAVASGNYKSLQTTDFKLTNDRRSISGEPPTLSAWFKEPAKDFTLIEIEMVQPHSVKKFDGKDYSNMFHNLFNDLSSIDDSKNKVSKHAMHDQSTHGSWANGGNGLGIEEVMRLHKSSDPLQSKIYEAEQSLDEPSTNSVKPPPLPKRDDFELTADYDKAYKNYSKKWMDWAVEEQASILSDTGKELLDGTPAGVKKYVEKVIKQDWFVAKFGDGSSLPKLDVKTSNTNAAGRHILKVQKDRATGRIIKTVHEISIDRQSVKNERTILHEISHYATAISETEPFYPHGTRFAKNHLYIVDKFVGSSRADALQSAYKSKGIEVGN